MMKNEDKNSIAVTTYNQVVKEYDTAFGDDYTDLAFIDKFLNSLSGTEIIDLGCGVGNLTNYMQKQGFNVTGIDLAEQMLTIAKDRYPSVNFKKMDMRGIVTTRTYDGISLLYSLHHLTKEEVKDALQKYYDLLNEDGKILLILEEGEGERLVKEPLNNNLLMFVNYYTYSEIKEVLENSGFNILYHEHQKETSSSLSKTKLVILCEKIL